MQTADYWPNYDSPYKFQFGMDMDPPSPEPVVDERWCGARRTPESGFLRDNEYEEGVKSNGMSRYDYYVYEGNTLIKIDNTELLSYLYAGKSTWKNITHNNKIVAFLSADGGEIAVNRYDDSTKLYKRYLIWYFLKITKAPINSLYYLSHEKKIINNTITNFNFFIYHDGTYQIITELPILTQLYTSKDNWEKIMINGVCLGYLTLDDEGGIIINALKNGIWISFLIYIAEKSFSPSSSSSSSSSSRGSQSSNQESASSRPNDT
jgi:hypothetical protein